MSAPLGPEVAEARNLHLQDRQHEYELAHRAHEHHPAAVGVPAAATDKGAPIITTTAGTGTGTGAGTDIDIKNNSSSSSANTLLDTEISEEEKPKGVAFALIILGLYLATFLFCLDVSIVAPAIPVITNEFRDTSSALWIFSIYLALNTCFQPIAGQFYRINAKWAFLVNVFLFEIGSLVCAVAPSMNVFIFGRALAGVGTAGGYVGVMVIIAKISPVGESTKWINGVGAVYSLGAVAGPLIGGAFVSKVTWRWCFYINLPIGGLTLLACFFLLPQPKPTSVSYRQRTLKIFKEIDWIGTGLVLAALIMMLMAFQWGGLKYSWSSSIIIGLLVGFFATVVVIIAWIIFRGENGFVRPRLAKQRSIAAAMACNFAIAGAYFTVISILAYYFQIRGSSALRSGVQLLPMIAGVVTSLVIGGGAAPIVGYTNPFLLAGMIIMICMLGPLTLFSSTTSTAYWAGSTFAFGFGAGLCFMMPFLLSQTLLAPDDLEIGSAMVLFMQTLGGAIVFAIGQAIFQNKYANGVKAIPNLANADEIVNGGITAFRFLAPPELVPQIEEIAIRALKVAYYTPIACLGLAILVAFPFAEWRSIKPPPKETDAEKKGDKISA